MKANDGITNVTHEANTDAWSFAISTMYLWSFFFFFLLLTPKISTLPFPPNHPQCLHTDDLMLFHDILENKGQEYYHVGTKEQKETVTTLDYTVKQGDAQEKRAA